MTITHYYPWAAQSRRFQEEIKNVFDRVLGDDTDQSKKADVGRAVRAGG